MEMLPGCVELQEDLERRGILNELDDVVALNGVNAHSDTCQDLDGGQFFYHCRCPLLFHLLEPAEGKWKSGVGKICFEFFLMSEQSKI